MLGLQNGPLKFISNLTFLLDCSNNIFYFDWYLISANKTGPCWNMLLSSQSKGYLGIENVMSEYDILTLTLFRYLPFLAYLIWNWHHQKWWFPPELIRGPLAHQSLEHPCQATPVTLPGQRFRTCIVPVSMT